MVPNFTYQQARAFPLNLKCVNALLFVFTHFWPENRFPLFGKCSDYFEMIAYI